EISTTWKLGGAANEPIRRFIQILIPPHPSLSPIGHLSSLCSPDRAHFLGRSLTRVFPGPQYTYVSSNHAHFRRRGLALRARFLRWVLSIRSLGPIVPIDRDPLHCPCTPPLRSFDRHDSSGSCALVVKRTVFSSPDIPSLRRTTGKSASVTMQPALYSTILVLALGISATTVPTRTLPRRFPDLFERSNADNLPRAPVFRRGLPPLPPRRQRSLTAHPAKRSATRRAPITVTGAIGIHINNQFSAFFTGTLNSVGNYGGQGEGNPTIVSVTYYPDSLSTPVNLQDTDSGAFIGGVTVASDNLGPSNSNYDFLGPVEQAGSGIESTIWLYDPGSGSLTPQWVNTDGGLPPTQLVYVEGQSEHDSKFVLTGDSADSADYIASASNPSVVVTFTLLPLHF
ncbi:hypothetical protein B0H11DRAFT_1964145, partial [Mycena galericulata]